MLKTLLSEKYIALFLQPETYNDYRRTGIPELEPVSGDQIPVRWPYSEQEHLYNSNAPDPTSIDIFMDRVGWNQ